MSSCAQSVSLPKEKAEFARQEIEKIAREYGPLADEAFEDESAAMKVKRAALRARLFTVIEFVLQDVTVNETDGFWETFTKAIALLAGAAQ